MAGRRWCGVQVSGAIWCVPGVTSCISKHGKQLAVCGLVTVTVLVLIHNMVDHGDASSSAQYTYPRGRIKSSGNFSHVEQVESDPITKGTLSRMLPDDVRTVSHPEEFFQCRPSQILKVLHSYHDLNRFDGCGRIFYNRVPKCGSRTVLSVFKELGEQNNYTVHALVRPQGRSFLPNIRDLVKFGMNFSRLEEPFLYSQHLHFVNFTQMGVPPPLYINVVRDPVDRVISHFHYNKYGSGADAKTQRHNVSLDECVKDVDACPFLPIHKVLPFFCGMEKRCRSPSENMLQRAKTALRDSYLVVGLTENLPAYFNVLETLMPNFFSNASTVYEAMEGALLNKTQTAKKPAVLPKTIQILKNMLSIEYEFYNYAKQRFYTLHAKLQSLSLDKTMETNRRKRSTAHVPDMTKRGKTKIFPRKAPSKLLASRLKEGIES